MAQTADRYDTIADGGDVGSEADDEDRMVHELA